MKINKQLFEDVLAGKLKGTFLLRNYRTYNSDNLAKNNREDKVTYPYCIGIWSYKPTGYFYNCISDFDIVDFMPETNMKQNELTIEIPEGKIIDWDESKKQNKIVLKDKPLTYEDVCKELFEDDHYTIAWEGYPIECCSGIYNASNATTKHQLDCILAKNKLATVAKYLNDGWKPNKGENVFYLTYRGDFKNKPHAGEYYFGSGENLIVFKTQKDAVQAIKILGEETIKLALEPLGI